MTAPEHSPLPWRVDEERKWRIISADALTIAQLLGANVATHNARLIVTAVNAHADLLAAAKSVLATKDMAARLDGSPCIEALQSAIAAAEEPIR